jgi:hypothetical protein
MGHRPVAAQAACPRPNERMEQTGAHPALGGHERPQRAGCSSAVVRAVKATSGMPCSGNDVAAGHGIAVVVAEAPRPAPAARRLLIRGRSGLRVRVFRDLAPFTPGP